MQDPQPQNITGQKRVAHSIEHQINWSHLIIGVVVLVALLKFGPPIIGSSSEQDEEIADLPDGAVDVEVESAGF